MKGDRWFKHPKHGHMLRRPNGDGCDLVVTALTLETLAYERDEALWRAYQHRLSVNAGCGHIAVDEYRTHDRNPEYRPIAASRVPAWIVRDFTAHIAED